MDNRGVEIGSAYVDGKLDTEAAGNLNEKGSCFCGAVKFTIQGKQAFSVLCHCTDCTRSRGTGPVHLLGVIPPTGIQCTEGQAFVTTHDDSRSFCSKCGCAVWGVNSRFPFGGVFPATWGLVNKDAPNNGARLLPAKYRPTAHINYQSRMWDQEDNLPKFKGFIQANCPVTNAGDEAASSSAAAAAPSAGGAATEAKASTADNAKASKHAAKHAAVTKFLEGLNLKDKAAASIDAGFDDMDFIATLNDNEVEEWSKYLDLKPGFKVKLRQAVGGLRK